MFYLFHITSMKTIGLCMIVKNESHIIERCLDSVKPLIDYVLIVDTGSTDNTIQTINDWLSTNSIPGQVISEPFKDFAYNRTQALRSVPTFLDYSLMLDADEILVFEPNFNPTEFKSTLNFDVYDVKTDTSSTIYYRPTITINSKQLSYHGVIHEFLAITPDLTRGSAQGFHNVPIQDSHRNQSPNKFVKDAEVLLQAFNTEPTDYMKSRYTFYLAQSYRDSANSTEALKYYELRSKQGFWIEEVYESLYNIAKIKQDLNYSIPDIIQSYFDAYNVSPHRAEPLYRISILCRSKQLYHQGYLISSHAISLPVPGSSLFLEKWIYDYGMLDEHSVLAYYSGHIQESKDICLRLLNENKIPPEYIDRIKYNSTCG